MKRPAFFSALTPKPVIEDQFDPAPLRLLRETLLREEAVLRFPGLNHRMALDLAAFMLARANAQQIKLTVEITLNRQQIFKFAMPGTLPAFDDWIARKRETVYHFNRSSWLVKTESALNRVDALAAAKLNPAKYVLSGGGVALRGVDGDLLGTATASGLSEDIDHQFIAQSISAFLGVTL